MAAGETRYTFDRVVRLIISIAVLAAVFSLLRYLSDVLLPFVLAVILAYLLNPIVTLFEQKLKRRAVAVGITLGGLLIIGLGIIAILVPLTLSQVDRFQRNIARLREDLSSTPAPSVQVVPPRADAAPAGDEGAAPEAKTPLGLRELIDGWQEFRETAEERTRSERLATLYERVSGTLVGTLWDRAVEFSQSEEFDAFLLNVARKAAAGGATVVALVVKLIVGVTALILVAVYLLFLLLDFPQYVQTWRTFLPPQYKEATLDFLGEFQAAMRRYFRGQSLIALCTGLFCAVGFSIIGLPLAIPLGLLIGVLNMVPYLQAIALVPALLLAVLRSIESDASLLASILLVLAVFLAAQALQDWLLTPRIMGKATGLRPVAILLGVFVWGKLLGFLGVLLAIPLTCLGIAYYRRIVLKQTRAETTMTGEGV